MSWWPGSGRATRTGASGSSTTSSRTSTSSSTSDRLGGFLRLIHPFPSLLDGVVVVAVALVAGAQMASAVLLGVSMTALQASIGSLNDRIDAPRDAGQKVGKPIPAGLVTSAQAGAVAAGAAAVGVSLAASVSLGLTGLALIVLAIGYGYDVWAKGTAWSWVPFAVGIPLLPVYGWFGATGGLAPWFSILIPAAVLTGTSLAIANARADVERDVAAESGSIAVALGDRPAWLVHAAALAGVVVLALAWLVAGPIPVPAVAAIALSIGIGLIAVGVLRSRGPGADRRERAWEMEAVGVALLAVGWLIAVAS